MLGSKRELLCLVDTIGGNKITSIKCLYNENTYTTNGKGISKLIGETKEGITSAVLQPDNEGYKTVLKVTNEGFTLTASSTDEVLRQGISTDIFDIYDTLLYKVDPLLVNDEIKDATLSYEDYLNRYGYGIVERTISAKFKLYTENMENERAIGVEHHHEGQTLAIYSLYEPYEMSQKETAKYITDYLYTTLRADEIANISAVNLPKSTDNPNARIYAHKGDNYRYDQVKALFNDALERKSSISETLMTREEAGEIKRKKELSEVLRAQEKERHRLRKKAEKEGIA